MLCHQNKCLFVHIPKAAGQSVESVFVERSGLTWQTRAPLLLRPNKEPEKGPPRLAHLTASEYISCGYISEADFSNYFKFSFVRNPWARLVSEYTYRRMQGIELYQKDFKHFLFTTFPQHSDDDYSTSQDFYRHIIPQWEFLYDDSGNCLVDFVGKFESLQQDFDQVCQQLSLPQTMLPHKNKTQAVGIKQKLKTLLNIDNRKPHYSYYYDDESADFVQSFYQKDIELFGYCFEDKTK